MERKQGVVVLDKADRRGGDEWRGVAFWTWNWESTGAGLMTARDWHVMQLLPSRPSSVPVSSAIGLSSAAQLWLELGLSCP